MRRNIITVSALLLPLLFLGWLLYKDALPSGQYEVNVPLNKVTPLASRLYPEGRVNVSSDNKDHFTAELNDEPVYFDARLPRKLDTATVIITYQSDVPVGVGVALPGVSGSAWRYDIQQLPATAENTAVQKSLTFQLSEAHIDKHRLRFIISVPELATIESRTLITGLKVSFSGKPLSASIVKRAILRVLGYYSL